MFPPLLHSRRFARSCLGWRRCATGTLVFGCDQTHANSCLCPSALVRMSGRTKRWPGPGIPPSCGVEMPRARPCCCRRVRLDWNKSRPICNFSREGFMRSLMTSQCIWHYWWWVRGPHVDDITTMEFIDIAILIGSQPLWISACFIEIVSLTSKTSP